MAEEHRRQAPQLCANNWGLFGSPATQNLCSKCHRDLQLKEHQSSSSLPSMSSSFAVSVAVKDEPLAETKEEVKVEEVQFRVQVRPIRCLTCNKRVGLTGFKCRCGMVLCGIHRYSEQHDCNFDFKAMGKEQIAKANPVVKAVKLQKI